MNFTTLREIGGEKELGPKRESERSPFSLCRAPAEEGGGEETPHSQLAPYKEVWYTLASLPPYTPDSGRGKENFSLRGTEVGEERGKGEIQRWHTPLYILLH